MIPNCRYHPHDTVPISAGYVNWMEKNRQRLNPEKNQVVVDIWLPGPEDVPPLILTGVVLSCSKLYTIWGLSWWCLWTSQTSGHLQVPSSVSIAIIPGTGALLIVTSLMEYCILHESLHENLLEAHSEAIAGTKYSDGIGNRHTKRCHMASLLCELAS